MKTKQNKNQKGTTKLKLLPFFCFHVTFHEIETTQSTNVTLGLILHNYNFNIK